MKLRILSDLHMEFRSFEPPAVEADAVILAGDIGSGTNGICWASKHFKDKGKPIIYVPGNHEFYGWDMVRWTDEAVRVAGEEGVILGSCSSTLLEKEGETPVRVLAATLWTDFELFGFESAEACGKASEACLYDYRAIQKHGESIRWNHTRTIHILERQWLEARAREAKAAGEKVVVATHHAPSLQSAASRFKTDIVTGAFASNLESFAKEYVDLWIHGHMHNNSWYNIGNCLVVANPRGYNPPTENPRFDASLVVDV